MDISDTIAPKSDQLNAEDLLSGERTFTITEVRVIDAPEQPVSVYLAEFPSDRPWKPSKTSRRVLMMGWGTGVGQVRRPPDHPLPRPRDQVRRRQGGRHQDPRHESPARQ
jgi:hypothetical protein